MKSNYNNIAIFCFLFLILIFGFFFIQPQKILSQENQPKNIKNLKLPRPSELKNPIDKIVFRKSSFFSNEPIEGIIYLSNKEHFPLYKGILEIRIEKLEKDVFPPHSLNAIKIFYIKDIDLLPNESKAVPFSFNLSNETGSGPYLIWVSYHTYTSSQRGNAYQTFELLDGEPIIEYPIITRVYDDPIREYRTPVVKPNSNLTAQIKIKNILSKPLSLKVKIKVYQFFDLDKIENFSSFFEKDFDLQANQEKQIEVNFPAPLQAGNYHVDIFILHEEKEIAMNREIIYVEGVSGEISYLVFQKQPYEKGEKVFICYEIEGPFSPGILKIEKKYYPKYASKIPQNTVPSPLPLIFNLKILQDSHLVKSFEQKIEIKDIESLPIIYDCVEFFTEKSLYNYSLFASLRDELGKDLDTIFIETKPTIEKITLQKQEEKPIPQKNKIKMIIITIIGVIILIGIIIWLISTLKKKTFIFSFLLFFISFLFFNDSVFASGCECVSSIMYCCENSFFTQCPSSYCNGDTLIYYLCMLGNEHYGCNYANWVILPNRTTYLGCLEDPIGLCSSCCVQYTQNCSASYCSGWQLVTGYCEGGQCKTRGQCNDNCCRQYCGGNGYCNSSGNCVCGCTPSCSEWSQCSVPCGGGIQTRTCVRSDCTTYTETQSCNTQPCPPVCGNGQCESGENCSNCYSDCPCPSGQVCENGTCVTTCTNQCSPSGTTQYQCSGNTVQKRTCGNYDVDSCLEWSSWSNVENCDSYDGCYSGYYRDYYCSNGSCTFSSICIEACCDQYHNNPSAYCSGGTCFGPLTNNPPSATNLTVSQPDYCQSGPQLTFSWRFQDPDGDSQFAYQVQVDNNFDFSSPEVDEKVNSSSQRYTTPFGKLNYNTTYYWRLKVWDSKGAQSSWILGPATTTPKHAYPTPDFTFSPENPRTGELVQFTDRSQAFGGATIKSWLWTFQDGNPSQSTQQNPTTTFTSYGEKQVTLTVTDSDNFTCSISKKINLKKPFLFWELLFHPSIWLKGVFASLKELFY